MGKFKRKANRKRNMGQNKKMTSPLTIKIWGRLSHKMKGIKHWNYKMVPCKTCGVLGHYCYKPNNTNE